jgi:hypothetical protein
MSAELDGQKQRFDPKQMSVHESENHVTFP